MTEEEKERIEELKEIQKQVRIIDPLPSEQVFPNDAWLLRLPQDDLDSLILS